MSVPYRGTKQKKNANINIENNNDNINNNYYYNNNDDHEIWLEYNLEQV